jgi:hypothetical protein
VQRNKVGGLALQPYSSLLPEKQTGMPMNPYLSKIMTYHEVHQLSREGFSISYISKHLSMNWRTVKRLISIEDDRVYEKYLSQCYNKNMLLEPYEVFVKSKLEQYLDTSSAQMHDWLKEHHPDFPEVSPKTVFNFIAWVRQKYRLPKVAHSRDYEMVEETPYGMQAQVDFGQYSMRNNQGQRVKVYFFTMVLSRSRYKYVYFSAQPFTSHTAIDAHERALSFFNGVADTLVYDQDRVFMVDENKGDLVLTAAFKNYSRDSGFKLHFCRKSDPQSKGKIENVVKYVKQNFLYNRALCSIDILNAEALSWLERTANKLPHGFTRKSPVSEWEIEKPFLQPLKNIVIPQKVELVSYTVRIDNSFSYRGNFYSLPTGIYKGRGTKVLLEKQGECLVIYDLQQQELCRHTISLSRGEKIINNNHKRSKGIALTELEDQFYALVTDKQKAVQLVAAIRKDKPRYIRDQLLLLLHFARSVPPAIMDQTLTFCCAQNINGAADFKAIIAHYKQLAEDSHTEHTVAKYAMNPLNQQQPQQALIQPATSSITDYDLF